MNIDKLLVDGEEIDIQGVDNAVEIIKKAHIEKEGKIKSINISLSAASEQEIGQLYEFVFQHNYPIQVMFDGHDEMDLEKINKEFETLFIRNQIKNLALTVIPPIQFSKGELRKAKVNLINGKKSRVGLQAQRQQQQEKQQQQQQQQQTTQQMMARRHHLAANYQEQAKPDFVQNEDVGNQEDLITRLNVQPKLGAFAEATFPNKQLDLTDVWQKLVGENAEKIPHLERKITHVKKDAMEKIVRDYPEFSYGLIFENLPAGFYLNRTDDKTILCYSEEKAKAAVKNPLAITLSEEKPPVLGDTSLLILSALPANATYPQIQQALLPGSTESNLLHTRFNKLINPATSLQEKNNVAKEILSNYGPQAEKIKPLLDSLNFSNRNKQGLARLLLAAGPEQLQNFLKQLNRLQSEGLYQKFKETFLDHMENYESLVTEQGSKNIEKFLTFNASELNWWHSLTEQHLKAGARSDFNELFAAFDYFVKEAKDLTKVDTLPAYCPFENIKHMKVTLDRALFLIRNAVDKEEQFYHLHGLDMRQEGAYYAAWYEFYKLVSAEMGLSPDAALPPKLPFPDKVPLVADLYGVYLATKSPGGLARIVKNDAKLIAENDKKNGFHYAQLRENNSVFHLNLPFGGLQPNNNFALYEVKFPAFKGFMTYQIVQDNAKVKKQARFFIYNEQRKNYTEYFNHAKSYTEEPIFSSEVDPAEIKRPFSYSYQYNPPGKAPDLFGFVDTLKYETNKKYFLRYVGEQKFALPLDSYKKILNLVSEETFSEDVQDVQTDNLIKKRLLQLLTFTTTGPRLSEVQDIDKEVQKLLDLIKLGIQKLEYIDTIPDFISVFAEMYKTDEGAKPTIADINTIIETCYQYNKMAAIRYAAERISIFTQQEGKTVYEVLNILNTRARVAEKEVTSITKVDVVLEFFDVISQIYNTSLRPIKEGKGPNALKQLYIIFTLTSTLDVDKAKALANAFNSIDDPSIRDELFAILSNINIEKSFELPSAEQLIALIDEIKGSAFTKDRKAEMEEIVQRSLPNTAFGNEPVAQTLAGLVNVVKQVVGGGGIGEALTKLDKDTGLVASKIKETNIVKLVKELQEELKKKDSDLDNVLELLTKIEENIKSTLKKVLKIPVAGQAAVRTLIKQAAETENEEVIQQFLKTPSLLIFMKTPLQDYFKSTLTFSSNELRTGNDEFKNYLLESLGDLEIDKSIDQALRRYSQRFDEVSQLLNAFITIKNNDDTEFRKATEKFFENNGIYDVKKLLDPNSKDIALSLAKQISDKLNLLDDKYKPTLKTIVTCLETLGEKDYDPSSDQGVLASNLAKLDVLKKEMIKDKVDTHAIESIEKTLKDTLGLKFNIRIHGRIFELLSKINLPVSNTSYIVYQLLKETNATEDKIITALNELEKFHKYQDVLDKKVVKSLINISLRYNLTKDSLFPIDELMKLKTLSDTNKNISRKESEELFTQFTLLIKQAPKDFTGEDLAKLVTSSISVINNNSSEIPEIVSFIILLAKVTMPAKDEKGNLETYKNYLTILDAPKDRQQLKSVMNILLAVAFDNEGKVVLKSHNIKNIVEKIGPLYQQKPELVQMLADAFIKTPRSSQEALDRANTFLEQTLNSVHPNMQPEEFDAIKNQIDFLDKDPCGTRVNPAAPFNAIDPKSIDKQFSTERVKPVISQIQDMYSKEALPKSDQAEIARQFTYINSIGYKYPVTFKDQKKPLKDFTREELKELSTSLVEQIRKNKNDKAIKLSLQLQLLAVMRESLFRATGKLPYSTQIISVLLSIYYSGNLLMQINTGEGKGITSALLTALQWAEGDTDELITANRDLAKRDCHEFRDFFDSLGVNSSLIRGDSAEGTYRVGNINYSNLSDMSLYHAAGKTFGENLTRDKNGIKIPTNIVLDEVDYSILDDKTLFNFSINPEDGGDPHVNKYAWVYPLINEFIDQPEFRNINSKKASIWTKKEDIRQLQKYLSHYADTQEQQIQLKDIERKLDRWLNAACNAKLLEKGNDFIVQTEVRKKEGIDRKVSIAVPVINKVPQVGASFSDGVQQFLHARLMKTTDDPSAPFPIDAEMMFVGSESAKNYVDHIMKKGRVIGISGSLGTDRELLEVREKLNCKALSIPPHDKNNRQMERPQFKKVDKDQLSAIRNAILDLKPKKANGKQPVLLVTENISTAKDLYNHLQSLKQKGFTVEVITGDEPEAERLAKLKESGKPNHILITTSFLGRGTDYKPEHPDGLFVIQTYLDNERTSRQIIGRTARNGKLGRYLAIYNNHNIMHTYDIDLNRLPKGKREEAIIKLQRRMDEEAAVERHYVQEVDGIKNVILDHVTKWQKLVTFLYKNTPQSKKMTDELLALREDIIKSILEKWDDILDASDPDRIYSNPYVRRDKAGQLDYQTLEAGLTTFENDVQGIWKQFKEKIIEEYIKPNVDLSKNVGAPDAQFSEKNLNKLRYDYLNGLSVAEAMKNRKTRLPSQPEEKPQVVTSSTIDSALDEDAAFLQYDQNLDDANKETLLIHSSFYQTGVALTEFSKVIDESSLSRKEKESLNKIVKIVTQALNGIPQAGERNKESLKNTLQSAIDLVSNYMEKTKHNLNDQVRVQKYTLPLLGVLNKVGPLNLNLDKEINSLRTTTIDNAYQKITNQLNTMLGWSKTKSWHYYLETPAAKRSAGHILEKLGELERKDSAVALKELYALLHKENFTVKNRITFGFGHKDIKKTIDQTLKTIDQLSAVSNNAVSLETVRTEAKEQASFEYFIPKVYELLEKENTRLQKLGVKMLPEWPDLYKRIQEVEQEDKTPYALLEIHFLLFSEREKALKTGASDVLSSAINRLFKATNHFVKEAKTLEKQPASLDKFVLLKQKQWSRALNVDAMADKPKSLHLRQIDSGFRHQFELVVEVDGAKNNAFYSDNLQCTLRTTKNPLVDELKQTLTHLQQTADSMKNKKNANVKNLTGLQHLLNGKNNLTIPNIQNTELEKQLKEELINYVKSKTDLYFPPVEKQQIKAEQPAINIEPKIIEQKSGLWSKFGGAIYKMGTSITHTVSKITRFAADQVEEEPKGPTATEKLQKKVAKFIGQKVSALNDANSAIDIKEKPLSEQIQFLEFKISKLQKQSEKTHFVKRFNSVEELLQFETTLKSEQEKRMAPQAPQVVDVEPPVAPQPNI